jgi:hypothetical protein
VRRHKGVAYDNVLAAGAGEAADEPIVDDLAIADRNRKNAPS